METDNEGFFDQRLSSLTGKSVGLKNQRSGSTPGWGTMSARRMAEEILSSGKRHTDIYY